MRWDSTSSNTDLSRWSCSRVGARVRRNLRRVSQVAIASLLVSSSVIAQETGSPGIGRSGDSGVSDEEYETLRQLLGLPAPTQPEVQPVLAPEEVEPEPAPVIKELKTVTPESAPQRAKPAVPRPAPAKKVVKPAARQAPKPVAPKAVEQPTPAPVLTAPAQAVPAPPAPAQTASTAPGVALPPSGTIVSAKNLEQWKHLLGPSIQWAVGRGATLDVVDTQPAPMEPRRQQATERYSSQVRLAADKRSMENYVAGIPFPSVTTDDPDVAVKVVFNFEARIAVDDLDIRKSSCDTADLGEAGVRIEKHYLSDHLRRLFYVGRLHNEPMPTWATQEGFRYREMVAGLIEPFDLKGAGYTYARYLSPSRQDDSWVYYPSSRRVRRLSTAQRSEGIFGTDIDLDSFQGYSGNPAWTEWKYLGSKPILGSLHARNHPQKFEAPPADFFPDDVWEVRDVHIIVGTPITGGGVFSRRVLYIDKESLLAPYAEIYDLDGGLWKGLVFIYKNARQANPTSTRVYDEEMPFQPAFSIFDMQLNHSTRCQTPDHEYGNEDGWHFNVGEGEGVTESVFSVAGVIGEAR